MLVEDDDYSELERIADEFMENNHFDDDYVNSDDEDYGRYKQKKKMQIIMMMNSFKFYFNLLFFL